MLLAEGNKLKKDVGAMFAEKQQNKFFKKKFLSKKN